MLTLFVGQAFEQIRHTKADHCADSCQHYRPEKVCLADKGKKREQGSGQRPGFRRAVKYRLQTTPPF